MGPNQGSFPYTVKVLNGACAKEYCHAACSLYQEQRHVNILAELKF